MDDDEPVTVTELRWQEIEGLEVVDFAIANFAADAGGVGLLHGTLEDEGLDSQTRVVEAMCDQPDDPMKSQAVLQVRLSDPSRVGRAKGLRLVADGSVSELDPMTIGMCPTDFGRCDDTTIE